MYLEIKRKYDGLKVYKIRRSKSIIALCAAKF